jgi:putative flippase GtrA
VRFGVIGAVSTVVSLAIFLLLRNDLGAIAANAVAVLATFVGNTWANARYTGHRTRPRWLAAIAVLVGALALTSVSLLAVEAIGAGRGWEIAVLLCTWALSGLLRLATVRSWSRAEAVA